MGRGIDCLTDLRANGIRARAFIVKIECEGGEADGVEALLDDIQRGALLSDKQHPLALSKRVGDDVV